MYRLHFTYLFTTFQYYKSNLVKTKISLLAMHHECMPVYTGTQYLLLIMHHMNLAKFSFKWSVRF